jgi:hypothetical protein
MEPLLEAIGITTADGNEISLFAPCAPLARRRCSRHGTPRLRCR